MANQRIFLRCKACGAEKFIAKRSMRAFHTVATANWQESWDAWFGDHEGGFCGDGKGPRGLDIFELTYEHTDKDGNPSGA